MRRSQLFFVAGLAASCRPTSQLVPPLDPAAQSAILAVQTESGAVSYTAIDLLGAEPLRLEVEQLERAEIVSLRETHAELGLREGAVDSSKYGATLPLPLATWAAEADGFEWSAGPPVLLAEFRRPVPEGCRQLRAGERWDGPIVAGTGGLVLRDGALPLVLAERGGSGSRGFVLEPRAGALEELDQLTVRLSVTRAIPDGTWTAGEHSNIGGVIARFDRAGNLQAPVVRTATAVASQFNQIEPSPTSTELFLMSSNGDLFHYGPSDGLQLLSRANEPNRTLRGAIARIDDTLYLVRSPYRRIERWRDGALAMERTDIDQELSAGNELLTELGATPGGDLFATTQRGQILVRGNGGWRAFAADILPGSGWLTLLASGPHEMIAGGYGGLVAQYSTETGGRCADSFQTNISDFHFFLEPEGDHVWVAGFNQVGESNPRRLYLQRLDYEPSR